MAAARQSPSQGSYRRVPPHPQEGRIHASLARRRISRSLNQWSSSFACSKPIRRARCSQSTTMHPQATAFWPYCSPRLTGTVKT